MKSLPLLVLALCGALATAQVPRPRKPTPTPPPLPPLPFALEDAFGGLTFSQPMAIVSAPGEKHRLFVVEKTGSIQVLTQLEQPTPVKKEFASFTARPDGTFEDKGECGVLGLAFHPDFARNGRFFVYYSLRIGGQLHQRVSRFHVSSSDANLADMASEQPLITQLDPANNHNGGDLHFGPDGFLYISVGDGGSKNDEFDNARFINKGFHAAILRIDVDKKPRSLPPNPHPAIARDSDGAAFYAVPADNPFIGAKSHHGEPLDPATVRTEIWATGLRNVWRFSFDPPTGRLFAGDVGQNLFEEIDLIVRGGDYGWSHREAMHPFDLGPAQATQPADFHPVEPIFEYPRDIGISITGGRVYRGAKFPALTGAYVCADYGFGRVIVLREEPKSWEHQIIAFEPSITAIAADPRDGELLFTSQAKGVVLRLKRNANAGAR